MALKTLIRNSNILEGNICLSAVCWKSSFLPITEKWWQKKPIKILYEQETGWMMR